MGYNKINYLMFNGVPDFNSLVFKGFTNTNRLMFNGAHLSLDKLSLWPAIHCWHYSNCIGPDELVIAGALVIVVHLWLLVHLVIVGALCLQSVGQPGQPNPAKRCRQFIKSCKVCMFWYNLHMFVFIEYE